MQIIEPSFEILTPIDREEILKHLEKCGRTCYKSEDKITDNSASEFVKRLVTRGHWAMLEFFDIQVRFVHNRSFSHEMVRHRLCSFAQESQRYVVYDEELTVIRPYWTTKQLFDQKLEQPYSSDWKVEDLWSSSLSKMEVTYRKLIEFGLPPQAARGVLPNDTKTEIVVKANLREWHHIFELRCSSAAHPDMRRVMCPLRDMLKILLPEIYEEHVY